MIITLTKLNFNVEHAIDYYKTLLSQHDDLHWYYTQDHNNPNVIDPKNKLDAMHGWGLQTIYSDLSFPYHCDLDPHNEGPQYFKNTKLVFGWAKSMLDAVEQPYRSFVFVYPSGDYLGKFLSTPPPHFRIYMPIISNEQSWLISHTDPVTKVLLVPGSVYLNTLDVDTEIRNDGTSDLVFLETNSPIEHLEQILIKFK